jgi:hypothetical protein
MKLVENWRDCWKWFSMWAMSAIGFLSLFLPMLWESLDESTKALIPPAYIGYVLFVVSVLGTIGRLIQQKAPQP